MPNRAEMRRAHRAAWKQWYPLTDDPEDRRVAGPPVDWPGKNRKERRATWRGAWRMWLEETIQLHTDERAA